MQEALASVDYFNPRPPRGGRPPCGRCGPPGRPDFNPRPPRGGRRAGKGDAGADPAISIHAPREGGDDETGHLILSYTGFQSTPPARGATPKWASGEQDDNDFNPRPPRGGRPCSGSRVSRTSNFNPRPPRGGRLSRCHFCSLRFYDFNPRPPRGGRPQAHGTAPPILLISIHAPREGGDFVPKHLPF